MSSSVPIRVRDAIAAELRGGAELQVRTTLPLEDTRVLIETYLPALVEALDAGLVTELEVAAALTDRFVVRLAADRDLPLEQTISAAWDETVAGVRRVIEQGVGGSRA